jgi:hypothetical protein
MEDEGMTGVGSLNLIHFLDFYFALVFLAGLWRRLGQYHSAARLVFALPGRWPKLVELVQRYRTIFWTWSMILPAALGLALWLLQMLFSRLIFNNASQGETALTVARLLDYWPALIFVIPLGVAMFAFDAYSLYLVGQIDRPTLEKQFDEAEYWLRSRTAHVVRVVTLGRINPRKMVAEEVEKALIAVGDMLNFTLWWVTLQIGLRFAFALVLWLTWAIAYGMK